MELFTLFFNFLDRPDALCLTAAVSALFKLYLLMVLFLQYIAKRTTNQSIMLLGCILFSALIADIHWFLIPLETLGILDIPHSYMLFSSRITNTLTVILHLSISLFIEALLQKSVRVAKHYKNIRLLVGVCLSCVFFTAIILHDPLSSHEAWALTITYFYILVISLQTIYKALRSINNKAVPRILQYQLQIFIFILITPFVIFKLASVNPFTFSKNGIFASFGFTNLTMIALTAAIYFCTRKLIRLRFLNVKDHVETTYNINFIKDFKKTLGELSQVANLGELKHITQQFFKNSFELPKESVHLYIRDNECIDQNDDPKRLIIEQFFNLSSSNPQALSDFMYSSKILIRDEIEFSAFYEQHEGYKEAILFLHAIDADLFLPVYNKKKLIAYLVIDHNARAQKFYSNVERDEMVVFAAYLCSIINLLRNRNLDALLHQEKELKEELYAKHQEISQYKESIRSFFRNSQERKVGILFYKGRRFIFGNQAAQDFIGCDPNIQRGHALAVLLKKLVKNVQAYQTAQTAMHQEPGKKFIITALPHLENNDIIFTIYQPDINDTIKMQADLLKDPSHWDYLLYLETTASGQLISQLIPGNGEKLLNFKIDLLKIALNKKATLLCLPPEDIDQTVDLIHTISVRKELSMMRLNEPEKNFSYAIQLFSINPLFAGGTKHEALLEKLDMIGSLYIENIHFLSLETQEALAHFIMYGSFHIFKSEQRITSDVRILCSSSCDLATLVEKGLFSRILFQELKKTSLTMPPLTTLAQNEFEELAENVIRQAIKTKSLEPMVALSDREKSKLQTKCPTSLQELRKKIYGLLLNKTQTEEMTESLEISPAILSSDPELTAIVAMGKEALKDRKAMEYLWESCNKNQTKIAALLGVNRSSVNRRCKDYLLL